jgi:hypothetical protein
MDYDLEKKIDDEDLNLNIAMPYGELPSSLLASRFEETVVDDDEEEMYNDYARGLAADRRPDTNLFEHERARGKVNAQSGRLQLQYYGHRGNANDPQHPEMFLGFGGPEDKDPRGINVDPDFKELKKQHEARTRFINFTPDANESITGGGRSEFQSMKDNQSVFKWTRDRLKIFSRQIDGRKSGKSKLYSHVSKKCNVDSQASYGDMVKDYTVNPQRKAVIISKQIIRDSAAYRKDATDAEFTTAKYTQHRRRQTKGEGASRKGVTDVDFSTSDQTKCYKAMGILMSQLVNKKREQMTNPQDMEFSEGKNTQSRKTAPVQKDLAAIMQSITTDNKFSSSDNTLFGKNATPVQAEHLARQVVYNHITPAHHLLNAEVIYKSVTPGSDTRKIKDQVITDASAPVVQDLNTRVGKSARSDFISGSKTKELFHAEVNGESTQTFNYKHAKQYNGDKRARMSAVEKFEESDLTKNRATNHTKYRITSKKDIDQGAKFSDNTSKERLGGSHGTKYMNRYIDRDGKDDEDFGK